MLLLVTLVWGATFIWMREIMLALEADLDRIGTTSVVAFLVSSRFTLAAAVLPLFPSVRKHLGNPDVWTAGLALGLALLAGFLAQMTALGELEPSTSAFLTSLYVVSTALLSNLFGEGRPSRLLWFGVLLATLGAGFIEGPPHLTWGWAEIITVFCAVCFAVHILLTQRYTTRMDPLALTFTSFVTVAVLAMVLALLTTKSGSGASDLVGVLQVEGVLIPLLCLGLLGSLVALGILNLYQRHLEPVRAAIIYTLEPVWATLYGLVLGLVGWTPWILVGGGLLVVGNLMVELTSQDEEE